MSDPNAPTSGSIELPDSYAAAGFGSSFDQMGARPAILVVDFSNAFTDPTSPFGADMSSEVAATNRLLEVGRKAKLPIIFTTVAYRSDLADAGLSAQKYPAANLLVEGSRLVEIDPRLGPADGDLVVVKKGPSAIFGTNVASILAGRGVDTVIVCGATTSGCVRATVVDLFQYSIPPLVPRECVGDRAEGPHESSLADMQAKYADVISIESALGYLRAIDGT